MLFQINSTFLGCGNPDNKDFRLTKGLCQNDGFPKKLLQKKRSRRPFAGFRAPKRQKCFGQTPCDVSPCPLDRGKRKLSKICLSNLDSTYYTVSKNTCLQGYFCEAIYGAVPVPRTGESASFQRFVSQILTAHIIPHFPDFVKSFSNKSSVILFFHTNGSRYLYTGIQITATLRNNTIVIYAKKTKGYFTHFSKETLKLPFPRRAFLCERPPPEHVTLPNRE